MFRSNMSRAAKMAIDGEMEASLPSLKDMLEFWAPVFESPSIPVTQHLPLDVAHQRVSLAESITTIEVGSVNIANGSAPGLDGITPAVWRRCPVVVRSLLYNMVLYMGSFPDEILASRTAFVPKKANATAPSNFRPISITSVVVRQLHKILAKRMMVAGWSTRGSVVWKMGVRKTSLSSHRPLTMHGVVGVNLASYN